MASLLLAVIYLAFISLGLPDSLLGAGWPVMHDFLNVPLSYAGFVSMIVSAGTVTSSLLSERATRKLGTRYVTLFSVLLTALALLGFSISTRFWMVCLWAVPYGLGAGSIDAALNNYVALHYTSRDMSWLHCFWGVGTIVSPYVMSLALTRATWQAGYRAVGLIQLVICAVLLLTLPLWKVHAPTGEAQRSEKVLGLRGALRIRGVPQLLLGFCTYCALESTCILWTSSYLIATRGVSPERAAAFASLFFIGITVGRFLAGFVSNKLGDRSMIRLGAGILGLGVLLLLVPGLPEALALAGCVILGLGCAPVYPSIIHATPDNFGPENSQAIIGVQMASAYVGSTFAPPLFGFLSARAGLGLLPVYVGCFGVLMIAMVEIAFTRAKEKIKARTLS